MINKQIPITAVEPGWLMKTAQKRLSEGREAEALTLARRAISCGMQARRFLPECCALLRGIGCPEEAERQVLKALPDASP